MMLTLVSGSGKDTNSPQFFCSTGNCTWPPVATLGFCSRCRDMTRLIDLDCTVSSSPTTPGGPNFTRTDCSAKLPNGTAGLAITGNAASFENLMNITLVGKNDELRYHAIRLLPKPLLTGGFRPPLSRSDFSATECSLSPCVLSVKPSVVNGSYSETLLDTFTERAPAGSSWLFHRLRPPWGLDRGVNPAANLSFGLSDTVVVDWQRRGYLAEGGPIVGFAETSDGHSAIQFCLRVSPEGGACTDGGLVSYIFNANYTASECGSVNNDTFSCAMGGIARAITKTMRNSGVVTGGTGIGRAFIAEGYAASVATFVRIQWYWLMLPAAVWILGVTTWSTVVIQTGRLSLPAWRDDPLPLLFLYDGDEPQDDHHDAPLYRSVPPSDGGQRAYEGEVVLESDGYSSWAYEKVADEIRVQLQNGVGTHQSAIRLVQIPEQEKASSNNQPKRRRGRNRRH